MVSDIPAGDGKTANLFLLYSAFLQEVYPAVNLLRKLTKASMEKAILFYDKRSKARPVNSVISVICKWKAGKAIVHLQERFSAFAHAYTGKLNNTKNLEYVRWTAVLLERKLS
jgi:hypothetical protein